MTFDIEKMRLKVLEIADPNSPYTQEDFNKEFAGVHTMTGDQDFYKVKFKFANKSRNEDPAYATDGSSGFDLRADLDEPILIKTGKVVVIPTGLFFHIPSNFEIQIRSRSGLAAKNHVIVLNAPGTIDADYRGEIKVILINHGEEDFVVSNGDRIAQAIIASVIAKNVVKLIKVDDITNDTERGIGGFGSTGLS